MERPKAVDAYGQDLPGFQQRVACSNHDIHGYLGRVWARDVDCSRRRPRRSGGILRGEREHLVSDNGDCRLGGLELA